jgi:glycosyltransferase involved in cell wall biosynthesis
MYHFLDYEMLAEGPNKSDLDRPCSAKYVIISPVRNEAQFIKQTLKAVAGQTVKPSEWIIVDDGSTDETAEIVSRYAAVHPWLKLVNRSARDDRQGDRQRGKGVIDVFYFGYARLIAQDYEFIIKLDGDVYFEPNYFEFLLEKFASNPKLGLAGGGLYERVDGKNWTLVSFSDHVGGPAKMYRRTCFEAMGGLVPALGWDGLDEWKALTLGWEVRSFSELKVLHYRIMGNATGPLKSKIEQGYGAHYMGYHPLYQIARGIRHVFHRPFLVGGMAMIIAYFAAWLQGREQISDLAVIHHVRHTQLRQLTSLLRGKRLYKS